MKDGSFHCPIVIQIKGIRYREGIYISHVSLPYGYFSSVNACIVNVAARVSNYMYTTPFKELALGCNAICSLGIPCHLDV
jgi:hypothetical protein